MPPGGRLASSVDAPAMGEEVRTIARVPMRAAIFRNGEIVADEMGEPSPAPGQALVRTLACGICGSDLHARKHARHRVELARHFPGRKPMDLSRDVVFGHE